MKRWTAKCCWNQSQEKGRNGGLTCDKTIQSEDYWDFTSQPKKGVKMCQPSNVGSSPIMVSMGQGVSEWMDGIGYVPKEGLGMFRETTPRIGEYDGICWLENYRIWNRGNFAQIDGRGDVTEVLFSNLKWPKQAIVTSLMLDDVLKYCGT